MRQLALYGMTVEKAFTPQLSLKETFTCIWFSIFRNAQEYVIILFALPIYGH